jgi:hypothetical protein
MGKKKTAQAERYEDIDWEAHKRLAAEKTFEWQGYTFEYEPGWPDPGDGNSMAEQYSVGHGRNQCAGLSANPEHAKYEFVEWLLTKRIPRLQSEVSDLALEAGKLLVQLNTENGDKSPPYWRNTNDY